MIEYIDEIMMEELAQQYKSQRPIVPPPDPITFQQQKSNES